MDADRAIGKPHSLWCAFAKLYERHGDIANARIIFEKAVQVGGQARVVLLASNACWWTQMAVLMLLMATPECDHHHTCA